MRFWPQFERHKRRKLRVPQVRQGLVCTLDTNTFERIEFDDHADTFESCKIKRFPGGGGRIFPLGVSRDDRVSRKEQYRQERFRPCTNAGQTRFGSQRQFTAKR